MVRLELGKKYKTRKGEVVTIIREDGGGRPFLGNNGSWYDIEGLVFDNRFPDVDDLVEEVKDEGLLFKDYEQYMLGNSGKSGFNVTSYIKGDCSLDEAFLWRWAMQGGWYWAAKSHLSFNELSVFDQFLLVEAAKMYEGYQQELPTTKYVNNEKEILSVEEFEMSCGSALSYLNKIVSKPIMGDEEENEMEMNIETFSKKNLKEAKKQYEEEKANQEIEYAKKQLRYYSDQIDRVNREIYELEEEKQMYEDALKVFK